MRGEAHDFACGWLVAKTAAEEGIRIRCSSFSSDGVFCVPNECERIEEFSFLPVLAGVAQSQGVCLSTATTTPLL